MSRQHDADLCDRIRALEQRVAELEGAKAAHQCHGHWHWGWQPTPYISTSPNISVGGNATVDSFTSWTDSFTGPTHNIV